MPQQIAASSTANYITVFQPGHSFSFGDPVYYDGANWQLAQADQISTLATGVVASVQATGFNVVTSGFLQWSHGLTLGEFYYLDPDTAGAYVSSPPATGQVQAVVRAQDANTVVVIVGAPVISSGGGGGAIAIYTPGTAYAVNDFFSYRETLYRVLNPIASAPAVPPPASVEAHPQHIPNDTAVDFGNQSRQILDFRAPFFGLGTQTDGLYMRSGGEFSWFRNGVHSDNTNNPGPGGNVAMRLDAGSILHLYGHAVNVLPRPNPSPLELIDRAFADNTYSTAFAADVSGVAGENYCLVTFNPQQVQVADVALIFADGSGIQFLSLGHSFREFESVGYAHYAVLSNEIEGNKVIDQLTTTFVDGLYRVLMRATSTKDFRVGAFARSPLSGAAIQISDFGTNYSVETIYGTVAL